MSWEVGLESIECPVSLIERNPAMLVDIQRFHEAKRVQRSGGILYGPDSSRWPARWWETVALLEYEIERAENAASRAISAYRASR